MTRSPGKEHGTNKWPPTGRVGERPKGDTILDYLPNFYIHLGWPAIHCQKTLWFASIAKDKPETSSINIKQDRHVTEQSPKSLPDSFSTWVLMRSGVLCFESTNSRYIKQQIPNLVALEWAPAYNIFTWDLYKMATSLV